MNDFKTIFKPFGRVPRIYVFGIVGLWLTITLLAWEKAPALIPTPSSVLTRLAEYLGNKEFYVDLLASVGLTLQAMFYSILIACGLAYASVLPLFRPIAEFLVKIRYMSLIGLVFTFTLLLHNGGQVKLSLLMFGIIPFFTLSLLSVIERVDIKEYDLCTTLRYSKWQTLWELIIYGRMESTIETIRTNFAMAWLMITMVEALSLSEGGIGAALYRANKYNELDKIFALQLIILCLGIMFDYLLQQIRYMLFPHVKFAEKRN